ncbi:UNVERIFIED_CONTAM: hypothetical protein K2H54_045657 [Gekko kuhli]
MFAYRFYTGGGVVFLTFVMLQVILSGIIGLTTWKRPMILLECKRTAAVTIFLLTFPLDFGEEWLTLNPILIATWKQKVNLFVLLSVICVLLNLAGFILGCQGAQFVSSVPRCTLADVGESKFCFCCEEFLPVKCTEKENALKLYPLQSCSAVHLLLKKVLFALCALNALTTTVCLVAAALRYLQIFATRRPSSEESQAYVEEVEEQSHISDPENFVPPVPPPSYFATFYSCTPRMNHR